MARRHSLRGFGLCIGLLAASLAGAHCFAQPPGGDRLVRLPPVTRTVPRGLLADHDDLIIFGAGSVRFRLPSGWFVKEVPLGREVFLLLTPDSVPPSGVLPDDGIWMTYHVKMSAELNPLSELSQLLPVRLKSAAADHATVEPPRAKKVHQWPALEQNYLVRSAQSAATESRKCLLVRTDWGIFEVHAGAPAPLWQQRCDDLEGFLANLRLTDPRLYSERVDDATIDAEIILGTWRTERGRLRLQGGGNIQIVPDRVVTVGAGSGAGQASPVDQPILNGRFAAQQDVLYVHWDDGTRINLRWKFRDDDLLLTDHKGQISQLKRIFE